MASLELRNGVFHIRWRDKRGKQRSESTGIHSSKANDALARKKLAAFEKDLLRGKEPAAPLTLSQMLDDVVLDYVTNKKKSLAHLKIRIESHLKPWFGVIRAEHVTSAELREYIAHRQEEGAANGTINRELTVIGRAFSLAKETERVTSIPFIPKLKESAPRAGFFDDDMIERLCRHLTGVLQSLVRFAYLTGWRLGEIRGLQWRHIHFAGDGEIRLDPGSTKNEDARVFPMTDDLRVLLEAVRSTRSAPQVCERSCGEMNGLNVTTLTPFVFPIGDFRKAWARAIYKAGLPCTVTLDGKITPHLIFHDLRRSAIRNMVKTGMSERVAMEMSGHKSRSVFDRYNVISEGDLKTARDLMNLFAKRSQSASKKSGASNE